MVYIYESHLGGYYVYDEEIDDYNLYCEECGDSDRLMLCTDDIDEVREFLKKRLDVFDSGGYQYLDLLYTYESCRFILEPDYKNHYDPEFNGLYNDLLECVFHGNFELDQSVISVKNFYDYLLKKREE